MSQADQPVATLLDGIEEAAEGHAQVTLGELVDRIGRRGFGPMILVPALFVLTPLGGVPLVPTFFAAVVSLFALQVALGRRSLWLPEAFKRRAVDEDSLTRAAEKLRPAARWMDRHATDRFRALTNHRAERIAALVVLGLCVTIPPLEIVPFAGAVPNVGIALIGLALTVRDGALMVLGLSAAALGLIGGPWLLISG
ncbi:exopolysaccharide biosynthesis protein [Pseudoponticoccus marisrubri]|uniref:Exopolysaccharide biosynthesis protein exod n=1 Tax=Pseudoponticoccus marisrubri TaxID=1685382 RepID=A0A0W7WKB7_9RHOB|nr:exopolysaccharide biosynthesis protein [Pseudoponticoccus marisrubri]KUF11061.1 hypothetical protein AVJ23_08365 [Pseudoponticoccus marisrubri]